MPFGNLKSPRIIHPFPEILHDVLDEDIQSLLAPMGLLQAIFLLPKYNIHGNYIKPNGFWSNLICYIGSCIIIALYFHKIMITEASVKTMMSGVLHPVMVINFTYFSIGSVINCLVCTLQSNSYVQLVLKMQESHRSLYDREFKMMVKRNWFYIISLALLHFMDAIIVQLLFHDEISVPTLICTLALFTFDLNLISAIRLMVFITGMLELWEKKFTLYSMATKSKHGMLKTKMLWKRMYYTYSCVMNSYNLLKNVYQWLILYHVAGTFFHSVLYVQMVIDFTKLPDTKWDHKITNVTSVHVNLWLVKNLALHSILAMTFDKFYKAQAAAEDACSMVKAQCSADSFKKPICKNVGRLKISEEAKFKLCRLFLVDTKYPLRLLSLITTYTIVLLQFGYQ